MPAKSLPEFFIANNECPKSKLPYWIKNWFYHVSNSYEKIHKKTLKSSKYIKRKWLQFTSKVGLYNKTLKFIYSEKTIKHLKKSSNFIWRSFNKFKQVRIVFSNFRGLLRIFEQAWKSLTLWQLFHKCPETCNLLKFTRHKWNTLGSSRHIKAKQSCNEAGPF